MKISQMVFSLQSGHEYMVEMAVFNVQRTITPKLGKPKVWFNSSACCLMVLYIPVKFRENISNSIRVMQWTRVHGRNGYVQCSKGNNCISRQTRLMVHFSANHLMVLYNGVKFHKNISKSISVMEWRQNYEVLMGGWMAGHSNILGLGAT